MQCMSPNIWHHVHSILCPKFTTVWLSLHYTVYSNGWNLWTHFPDFLTIHPLNSCANKVSVEDAGIRSNGFSSKHLDLSLSITITPVSGQMTPSNSTEHWQLPLVSKWQSLSDLQHKAANMRKPLVPQRHLPSPSPTFPDTVKNIIQYQITIFLK